MIEIKTIEDFENYSTNSDMFVLKFGAEWCGPCRTMEPVLERLSNEIDGVLFAEADVDEAEDLAASFAVMNIPTVIIFKGGEMVDRLTGLYNESDLRERIEKFLKTDEAL